MGWKNWILSGLTICLTAWDAGPAASTEYKSLKPVKTVHGDVSPNYVRHRCLTPPPADVIRLPLERDKPWSLPRKALAPDFDTTINILVLRFNFQYENPDDPNTTGRGVFDLSTDTTAFLDSAGHMIDPPPRDSLYFDAHMRALRYYWEFVSDGKVSLRWDIWPPGKDSAYQLPHRMSYYGRCDSVVIGLEHYFTDCIATVDSVSPELHFGDYKSIFLIHAGADRQTDIASQSGQVGPGFVPTCNDLFSGFINFGDSVAVDSNTHFVRTGLILPETESQDGRATAMNGLIAHEFGHQLGLLDLYDTRTFMTQIGDFSLMDDNGMGTGVSFGGFRVDTVLGTSPVYPEAWSRAFLGFVDVYDFRQGTDITVAAAEVKSQGIKVARVPISDKEYYLIENRLVDVDGQETVIWADKKTSVILGPGRYDTLFSDSVLTGEYDFLLPGSGLLIFHVDEGVLGLDIDGDGRTNFQDNKVQWDWDRRFITLVEADGHIDFGGGYHAGYGSPGDMFRDDRKTAFTPVTNPPTIDNSGNNTHIYITGISRVIDSSGTKPVFLDSLVRFDVETDKLSPGFPRRAGYPVYGLNPVVDDIDRNGTGEIIIASGDKLSVITGAGESLLLTTDSIDCAGCPVYQDSAFASVHPGRLYPLALYARTTGTITAGPVTGDFGIPTIAKYVAIGHRVVTNGWVRLYQLTDNNLNGQADELFLMPAIPFTMPGVPVALSFGGILWALDDRGNVVRIDSLAYASTRTKDWFKVTGPIMHGTCRIGQALVVMAGDSTETKLYYLDKVSGDTMSASFSLGAYFNLGPIAADFNRDSLAEIVAFSPDGRGIVVSVDTATAAPTFSVIQERATSFHFTVNPIAGDVDGDGFPDIIVGGTNHLYAFNHELTLKTDFPIELNNRRLFQNDDVIWPAVMADIQRGGRPEIVCPTNIGNIYSYGDGRTPGFPLSGGEKGIGSPVILSDTARGQLGYLGADGWFYCWDVDSDTSKNYWPMGGSDAAGTFALRPDKLGQPEQYAGLFPKERFYNYPNPVVDGQTTIRYFLGRPASRVLFTVYDLSGEEVARFDGPAGGGVDNEYLWDCSRITPGVYRCVVKVDFGGETETGFTDIAIIR